MIFPFIEQHKDVWPIRLMCDTLGVSTAGFYAWRSRPTSEQQQRRDALLVEIRAVHVLVKERYGSPRIHAELKANGVECCVNTVAKLMHDNDLRAKTARKFRNTTDSNHPLPVADNLLSREFEAQGQDRDLWPGSRRGVDDLVDEHPDGDWSHDRRQEPGHPLLHASTAPLRYDFRDPGVRAARVLPPLS